MYFEQHREQRWSIFHNLYRPHHHPCFSRTGFYWLCHVAAWKNILGSCTCKILYSAGRVLSRFPPLSTWLTYPYPRDANRQQPSISCPFGKGIDKDFLRLYIRGRLSTFTTGVFSQKLLKTIKFPQFLPCATDYWFISILTNFVEQGSSGDYPFQQCCSSASLFVKCV